MMYVQKNVITITLTFIGLAITLFAQTWIDSTYSKYKKIGNKYSMTGKDVARKILDKNGYKFMKIRSALVPIVNFVN